MSDPGQISHEGEPRTWTLWRYRDGLTIGTVGRWQVAHSAEHAHRLRACSDLEVIDIPPGNLTSSREANLRSELARVQEQLDQAREKIARHEFWWDEETTDTFFIAVCEQKTNEGDPCPMPPWVVTDVAENAFCEGGNPDWREPDTGAHVDCSHPRHRCKVLKVTGAALASGVTEKGDGDGAL